MNFGHLEKADKNVEQPEKTTETKLDAKEKNAIMDKAKDFLKIESIANAKEKSEKLKNSEIVVPREVGTKEKKSQILETPDTARIGRKSPIEIQRLPKEKEIKEEKKEGFGEKEVSGGEKELRNETKTEKENPVKKILDSFKNKLKGETKETKGGEEKTEKKIKSSQEAREEFLAKYHVDVSDLKKKETDQTKEGSNNTETAGESIGQQERDKINESVKRKETVKDDEER